MNKAIAVMGEATDKPFSVLAADGPIDLHYMGSGASVQLLPFSRFNSAGDRVDNITDWGVKEFKKRYGKTVDVTRERIFSYVYAVLHFPGYREKYAQNLKRELPRIPLYDDFVKWATQGRLLLDLHIGFEAITPWPMVRHDKGVVDPRPKLKVDPSSGSIILDEATTLSNVPASAWKYRLGNRSAIEWVLNEYKESKPRDPTLASAFDSYRFRDHKEAIIDLLARVCRLSVDTEKIIAELSQ